MLLLFKRKVDVVYICSFQVDKHIRRLDADLARFENELKEKLDVSGYESPDSRALKSESEVKQVVCLNNVDHT